MVFNVPGTGPLLPPRRGTSTFPGADAELPYVWPDSAPPAPEQGPISAWVLRAPADAVNLMRERAFVGIRPAAGEDPGAPFGSGTRNTKRRRQIRAFVQELDAGELVLVPHGETLLVAEVAGTYEWWQEAPEGLHHTRHVRWVGALDRGDLSRPVHLQDPRIFFPLHNERRVAGTG